MDDELLALAQAEASDGEVAIDYVKSSDFHVVWADGGIGAITPNGHIHLALYAERPAIPRRQIFQVEKIDETTARLGVEVVDKRLSRNSIVREMACDVMLTPQAAENVGRWLLARAEEIKSKSGDDKSE